MARTPRGRKLTTQVGKPLSDSHVEPMEVRGPAGESPIRVGSIAIREASAEDNAALLALTSVTPMHGTIPLRIDRAPDFFRLLNLRGDPRVLVATHCDRVVGCISGTVRTAFVSGVPQPVGYIGDIKVHPSFAGSRVVLRLISALRADLLQRDVDLLFAVIAAGNRRALALMEGRLGTPRWRSMGRFKVHEILPSPFRRGGGSYDIGGVRSSERESLVEVTNRFNRAYQFGTRLGGRDARGDDASGAEPPFVQTLVARSGDEVVAGVTAFDTAAAKANVLVALPAPLRMAVTSLRPIRLLLPGFTVPSVGEPLRLLYLRNPAHAQGHERALRALIQSARYEAYRRGYSFVVLGVHERDPLRALVRNLPKFVFVSQAFAMSLKGRNDLEAIAAGIPMEDYALV